MERQRVWAEVPQRAGGRAHRRLWAWRLPMGSAQCLGTSLSSVITTPALPLGQSGLIFLRVWGFLAESLWLLLRTVSCPCRTELNLRTSNVGNFDVSTETQGRRPCEVAGPASLGCGWHSTGQPRGNGQSGGVQTHGFFCAWGAGGTDLG